MSLRSSRATALLVHIIAQKWLDSNSKLLSEHSLFYFCHGMHVILLFLIFFQLLFLLRLLIFLFFTDHVLQYHSWCEIFLRSFSYCISNCKACEFHRILQGLQNCLKQTTHDHFIYWLRAVLSLDDHEIATLYRNSQLIGPLDQQSKFKKACVMWIPIILKFHQTNTQDFWVHKWKIGGRDPTPTS